ncbi:hypothetical protein QFZ20_000756 [Flavobacterium sp. W4I14]|nr:hypothetical protein [Flavobacterium sp. W4I14]
MSLIAFIHSSTYKSISGRLFVDGDSSSAGKDQISPVCNALKGKSYRVNMSNTGRVIATFGVDLTLKDIVAKMTDVPEEVKKVCEATCWKILVIKASS